MTKLYWTEREEIVIKQMFGAISRRAFESKPELILFVFDQKKIDKIIDAGLLGYEWSERKRSYEVLNELNFRSGNTFQTIELVKQNLRPEMYKWLIEYGYFKEVSKKVVTTARMEKAEEIIAGFLYEKNNKKNGFYEKNVVEKLIKQFEKNNFKLSDDQNRAVHTSLKYQLSFINGSAGSGKTTALKAFIYVLKNLKISFQGMSPTGKAAKRLSTVTDTNAITIHSFLKLKTISEKEKEEGLTDIPWEDEEEGLIDESVCSYAIVDEASMLSLSLLARLIEKNAVTSIVFVGDDKQLPPVEPGNFLDIILRSNKFNTTRLGTIKRQLEDSNILKVANNIINDTPKDIEWEGKTDIEFIPSLQFGVEKVIENYLEDYKQFGPSEVVMLTPMKSKDLGTKMLNALIRDKVNPPKHSKKEIENFETIFRVGDLVMNTKNKYLKNKAKEDFYVPNGEIGIIREAFMAGRRKVLVIEFDGKKLYCDTMHIGDIIHAYAMTIHKSQGSEYQRVYLITHKNHSWMLKENMLYTGITRAKGKLTVYGNVHIFNRAALKRDSKLRKSLFYPWYIEKVKSNGK